MSRPSYIPCADCCPTSPCDLPLSLTVIISSVTICSGCGETGTDKVRVEGTLDGAYVVDGAFNPDLGIWQGTLNIAVETLTGYFYPDDDCEGEPTVDTTYRMIINVFCSITNAFPDPSYAGLVAIVRFVGPLDTGGTVFVGSSQYSPPPVNPIPLPVVLDNQLTECPAGYGGTVTLAAPDDDP